MSLQLANDDPSNDYLSAGLQPDAEWKKIQENTFTRWVNKHLKTSNVSVTDLETDFEEGLKLIRLVEVLSGKSLGRFNKRVTFRSQKLENISLALNFLENEEHIKIVNIDSSAIVDQNLKLILGLVWTLILHYSISKAEWELPDDTTGTERVPDRTPKQKLMLWIKTKLPHGLPLNNFTSDWNDGVLLGALVDSCAPGLDLDWRNWVPDNALQSTETAMNLAEQHLDIAPLITAEELINPAVDEKSVMTYLAQFPQAQYKPPMGRVSVMDTTPIVNVLTTVTVHTLNDRTVPEMNITAPDHTLITADMRKVSSTVYEFIYKPLQRGEYQIAVKVRDPANGDVSELNVERAVAIDSAKFVYEPTTRLGKTTSFRVQDAQEGLIELVVVDPKGNEVAPALERDGSTYSAELTPRMTGLYSVNVFHKKKHIPGSPFALNVSAQPKFRTWGRGIAPEGVRVGDEVIFAVDGESQTVGPLNVHIRDPSGKVLPVHENVQGRRHVFVYKPLTVGSHQIELMCDGEQISKSPYEVRVGPTSTSLVRAFGPGLEGGVAKLPGIFYVETNGETDGLGFSIEGPSKTEINCTDVGDGCAVVKYTPIESGVYEVTVLSRSEHIKDSPFVMMIDPANEQLKPSAVRVQGIQSNAVFTRNDKCVFQIDISDAGVGATPRVKLLDSQYSEVPVTMTELKKGLYECSFRPITTGRCYVNVSAGGVAVPGSPFMVKVREAVDASQVRVYGPGLGSEVRSQEPTHFIIDAKGAELGEVEVSLCDKEGAAVHLDVQDNNDGSFTVKYTAPRPGSYQLKVVFAGVEIPKVEIKVKPNVDISSITVEGLENATITVNCEKEVRVFTCDVQNTRIVIRSPSGRVVAALSEPTSTGLRVRFIPREIGDYTIEVTYEHLSIPHSPFKLRSILPPPLRQDALPISRLVNANDRIGTAIGGTARIEDKPNGVMTRNKTTDVITNGTLVDNRSSTVVPPSGALATTVNGEVMPNGKMPENRSQQVASNGVVTKPQAPAKPATNQEVRPSWRVTCTANQGKPSNSGLPASVNPGDNMQNSSVSVKNQEVKPVERMYVQDRQRTTLDQERISNGKPSISGEHEAKPSHEQKLIAGVADIKSNETRPANDVPVKTHNAWRGVKPAETHDRGRVQTKEPIGSVDEGPISSKSSNEIAVNGSVTEVPNEDTKPNSSESEMECTVESSVPPEVISVSVTGPGLGTVLVARSTHVLVDAKKAGFGNIDLFVDGPSKTPIRCIDNRDGTCSVFYEPMVTGVYYLRVMFDNCHVPGSPFKIVAQPPVSERLKATGSSRRHARKGLSKSRHGAGGLTTHSRRY